MAVVFISPIQRQKMFFLGITIMFILFLAVISFGVFLSKPDETSVVLVFNKPKVNVNLDIFTSEQFKGLQEFTEMKIRFEYTVLTKDNREKTGFISATSIKEAEIELQGQGYIVIDLQEAKIGRINPFTPYYQSVVIQAPKTTTIKK
ncbi:MAG: hypothetical protein WCK10_01580 [Candidatus Staskawiczbacteria bacterium]